jgi:hypothetical protein
VFNSAAPTRLADSQFQEETVTRIACKFCGVITLGIRGDTLRRSIIFFITATLLLGCASPSQQGGPIFSGLESPAPGMARLYIFRPLFDESLKREAPLLHIDSSPIVQLAHGSFTHVSLPPGKHLLELKAGTTERAAWNKSIEVTVTASMTYFLAMWMNMDAARSIMFIPIAGAVAPVATMVARPTGVLHEFVSEAQAIDAMSGLFYVPPMSMANPSLKLSPHDVSR